MRVPRKINVSLQTFKAWTYRTTVDPLEKPSDLRDALEVHWEEPDKTFTPHAITISSGSWAAGDRPNYDNKGLL